MRPTYLLKYPYTKLKGKAYNIRHRQVKAERKKYHDIWANSKGQPEIFDVGRLKSPMWRAYLDNDRWKTELHEGVRKSGKPLKAKWHSKWEHPKSTGLSTKRFLNLTYSNEDMNDMNDGEYISTLTLDSILKREFAKLKHKSKHSELTDKILLLSEWDWENLKDNHFDQLVKRFKGKSPEDYDKIYLPCIVYGMHWILAIWNFKKNEVETYDSAGGTNKTVQEKIHAFLEHIGSTKTLPTHTIIHGPKQRDGSNCGYYVIAVTKALIRNQPLPANIDASIDRDNALYEIKRGRVKFATKMEEWGRYSFRNFKKPKKSEVEAYTKKWREELAKRREQWEALKKQREEERLKKIREQGSAKMNQVLDNWSKPKPPPPPPPPPQKGPWGKGKAPSFVKVKRTPPPTPRRTKKK
jgi:hypothetical protein